MSKRSKRERRRSRRRKFFQRFKRSAPNNCITCAFEALAPEDFRCAGHGPLSSVQRQAWRCAHPGYAKASDEDRERDDAYMRANGRTRRPPRPI